jgi:hypothetical protein
LTEQEAQLDRSEDELDRLEQTHRAIEQWIAELNPPPDIRYAVSALEDAKELNLLLDQETRFRRQAPQTLKDYLCLLADLKVRLDALGHRGS